MIAVAPEVLAALVRSYLDEPVAIPDAQIDALESVLPVSTRRMSAAGLEFRLESGPVPSPAAAFTGESAGFPSPAAVEDAIDTIRTLSESGVSPAESVDLDRIFSMLSSVRG